MSTELSPEAIPSDQYAVTYVIEKGPYAVSALALDLESGAPVFIKPKGDDFHDREALIREAALLSDLSHPQIPELIRAELDEEVPYIVTEAMPGHPRTGNWIGNRPMPGLAARLCLSALEPLDYLHRNGITHRDVKTKNLVLHTAGTAALVDFELGIREAQEEFQPEGRVWATVDYVAPERVQGESGGPPADVYSMGIVMYELFFGRVPFTGKTPLHLAVQQCTTEVDWHQNGRRVPGRLIDVMKRALQKKPEDRYGSAGEMREDLLRYLQEDVLRIA